MSSAGKQPIDCVPNSAARGTVDVVVVTYNSVPDLVPLLRDRRLFESFRRVVVVDNASTDASASLAADAGCAVIRLPRNVGFAAAANIGAASTSSEVFAVLNPDINIREAQDLVRLAEHFADASVGAVAPALQLPNGDLQDSARTVPRPIDLVRRRFRGTDTGRIVATKPVDVPWVVGACLLLRRTSFDEVGGFDHRYPLYFEDVDLCVRLTAQSWKVRYDPGVVVDHVHRAASRKSIRSQASAKHVRSAARFYARNGRFLLPSERRPLGRRFTASSAGSGGRRPRVHLAASPGGHVQLLRSVADVFDDHQRTWITAPGAHADDLRQSGERVLELPRVRGVPRSEILRNLVASVKLATTERPELVVTSGADMVVPFCLLARIGGAQLVFTETMARVTSRSLSARMLTPFAVREFVQWPELGGRPRATLVWPAYLEDLPRGLPAPGKGTMVTVGTHTDAFPRLVSIVEAAGSAGVIGTPVHAQSGFTPIDDESLISGRPWYEPHDLADALARADLVVTHAGAGAIFAALRCGKRPIVIGRRQDLGEHRDDHQMELVTKLSSLGLVVAVEDEITEETVRQARLPFSELDRPAEMTSLRVALAELMLAFVKNQPLPQAAVWH